MATRCTTKESQTANGVVRGPAKVVGHLATKVIVVHGSRVIRCSSSRVIPVNYGNNATDEDNKAADEEQQSSR